VALVACLPSNTRTGGHVVFPGKNHYFKTHQQNETKQNYYKKYLLKLLNDCNPVKTISHTQFFSGSIDCFQKERLPLYLSLLGGEVCTLGTQDIVVSLSLTVMFRPLK